MILPIRTLSLSFFALGKSAALRRYQRQAARESTAKANQRSLVDAELAALGGVAVDAAAVDQADRYENNSYLDALVTISE
ncbi:unnamed protein product [Protopolystoma xenopodis]|uniref:Uncharacterized protein n=1 Tax=Protopolystoma xenopodis TaxID=117903 RepID=A0A448XR17_9PLAT|nr:unnamed protein product [Protopolystoma xenopodis]